MTMNLLTCVRRHPKPKKKKQADDLGTYKCQNEPGAAEGLLLDFFLAPTNLFDTGRPRLS